MLWRGTPRWRRRRGSWRRVLSPCPWFRRQASWLGRPSPQSQLDCSTLWRGLHTEILFWKISKSCFLLARFEINLIEVAAAPDLPLGACHTRESKNRDFFGRCWRRCWWCWWRWSSGRQQTHFADWSGHFLFFRRLGSRGWLRWGRWCVCGTRQRFRLLSSFLELSRQRDDCLAGRWSHVVRALSYGSI